MVWHSTNGVSSAMSSFWDNSIKLWMKDSAYESDFDFDEDSTFVIAWFESDKGLHSIRAEYTDVRYENDREDAFIYTLSNGKEVLLKESLFGEVEISKEEGRLFWENLVDSGFGL